MMYFDTSALVKYYVKEKETDQVRELISRRGILATHEITYIEIYSCFARLNREGVISEAIYQGLKEELDSDWENFVRLKIDPYLIKRASDFSEAFALRAYDSVHLAAAQVFSLSLSTQTNILFACFDQKLNRAAKILGFETIPSI